MLTVNYTVKALGVVNQYYPVMLFSLVTDRGGDLNGNVKSKSVLLYGKYTVYEYSWIPRDSVSVCLRGTFCNFLN